MIRIPPSPQDGLPLLSTQEGSEHGSNKLDLIEEWEDEGEEEAVQMAAIYEPCQDYWKDRARTPCCIWRPNILIALCVKRGEHDRQD